MVPLTLTVFRFSSLSALISPEYKWETLGSVACNATSLSYVFNTTTVQTNETVQKGDRLGLAVAGSDLHEDDMILLQQGSGQNSLRGLDGKTSPVYVRSGRGLKSFATIV